MNAARQPPAFTEVEGHDVPPPLTAHLQVEVDHPSPHFAVTTPAPNSRPLGCYLPGPRATSQLPARHRHLPRPSTNSPLARKPVSCHGFRPSPPSGPAAAFLVHRPPAAESRRRLLRVQRHHSLFHCRTAAPRRSRALPEPSITNAQVVSVVGNDETTAVPEIGSIVR